MLFNNASPAQDQQGVGARSQRTSFKLWVLVGAWSFQTNYVVDPVLAIISIFRCAIIMDLVALEVEKTVKNKSTCSRRPAQQSFKAEKKQISPIGFIVPSKSTFGVVLFAKLPRH